MVTSVEESDMTDRNIEGQLADRSPLHHAIYKTICDFGMGNMTDDDGYPYPLVDLMSNPAPDDISSGQEQIVTLADDIEAAIEQHVDVDRIKRNLTDPQRMLWWDDVKGICPDPSMCFEYNLRVRCGPCAVAQSRQSGVEPDLAVPCSPELSRLRREIKQALVDIRMMHDIKSVISRIEAIPL